MKKFSIEKVEALFPELGLLDNKEWAKKVCLVWKQAFEESKWKNIEDAQHNHMTPGISLIDHSRSVAINALNMVETLYDIFKVKADKDVTIVSCLLHEVCKLVELNRTKMVNAKKAQSENSISMASKVAIML